MAYNYKPDSGECFYTKEYMAKLREKKVLLMSLLFENGDFGFYHTVLCDTHKDLARYYIERKDSESALAHLSAATDSAIGLLEFMNTVLFTHTSLIFKGMQESPESVMTSDSDNQASEMLAHLLRTEYDAIRNEPRFIDMQKRLEPYSGKNNY